MLSFLVMSDLPTQLNLADVPIDGGNAFGDIINPMRIDGGNSMDSTLSDMDQTRVWTPDFADDWMYCMVLPPNCFDNGTYDSYTGKIQSYGLEVFSYKSDAGNIIVLIRPTDNVVRLFADELDFKMKTNAAVLEKLLAAGDPESKIEPITIRDEPKIAGYKPYEMIYFPYSTQVPDEVYKNTDRVSGTPFSHSVKARLTGLLLETKPKWGGENIKVVRYISQGKILGFFPLHEPDKLSKLHRVWLACSVVPWTQPFHHIKEYFGEKVGLYFLFQGHYTRWLLGPAIIGLVLQLVSAGLYRVTEADVAAHSNWNDDMVGEYNAEKGSDAPYMIFYAAYLCLWAVFMLENWKVVQSKFALEWGMDGYEETEPDMPEFKGERTTSLIDGSPILFFPAAARRKFEMQSIVLVVLMIGVVIGCVASIYIIKDSLVNAGEKVNDAQTIASVINAIQIQVANYLYQLAAWELTKRENHRTLTANEDALITKIFAFQFVNSYGSFFYVGFFAEHKEFNRIACESEFGCCGINGCMYALGLNLAVIFGTRLMTGNVLQIIIPWIIKQVKCIVGCCTTLLTDKPVATRPEAEFKLNRYDASVEITAAFSETAIQMGYQCLFAVALPVASTFALVSNLVEVRGSAWKLLTISQRPKPIMVEDIGAFQGIFTFLAAASVLTNMSLCKFTMTTFDSWNQEIAWWIYMGGQWGLFFLMVVASWLVQDESSSIYYQKARAAFYKSKIIDKQRDDDARREPAPEQKIPLGEYPTYGGFSNMASSRASGKSRGSTARGSSKADDKLAEDSAKDFLNQA